MLNDSISQPQQLLVCPSSQLAAGGYKRVEVLFRGQTSSVIVTRYKGEAIAYRNWCVHMPRTLDCEGTALVDNSGENLRCSMHGIVYSLANGESLSEICRGKKLTPIRVIESEQQVYINDRRVKPI